MENKQVEKRLAMLGALVLLWGALILIRLVLLQVVEHQKYLQLAHRGQTVQVKIPAARGSIFDRNRKLLAMSTRLDRVFVNPLKVPDLSVASEILSSILDIDHQELYARLGAAVDHRQGYLVVKSMVTPEESARLRDLRLDWISLDRQSQRHYPNDSLAAHLLGSVNFEEHGNGGIEQSMDNLLHGQAGMERLLTDVHRRGITAQQDVEARTGTSLTLSIDERIQFVMERELAKAVVKAHGRTGSAIAMNPKTGQIYAMASYPFYDPTKPPAPGESKIVRFNHAVSVPFEPGSVFKVITLSAALETTSLRPESIINCNNGAITLFGRTIHEAHGGFGAIPMFMVLAKSSNIGAIQIGMRVGQQNLYEYVRRFGFGQRTGIELPAESKGMLRTLKRWGKTSLASIAMGHEISVSSVQLARACSVIANGGLLVKPRLILRQDDREAPMEAPQRIIRPETAIAMRKMMEGVVLFGTGKQFAQLSGYYSGGKTGSAQIFDVATHHFTHFYNASFMGFAPLKDPAVVVVVTVNGTHQYGGTASAPAYKVIIEEALRILNVPKDFSPDLVADARGPVKDKVVEDDSTYAQLGAEGPNVLEDGDEGTGAEALLAGMTPAEQAGPKVPDFHGKTMRDVAQQASEMGLNVSLDGSGIARMQQPPPGSPLHPGERIRVLFAR